MPPCLYILNRMVKSSESRLNLIFSALSDPTRRSIFARLEKEPRLSISDLAEPFAITLPAVLKHVDILCETGLVRRAKTGRTVWVEIEPGSLRFATDWLQRHRRFWSTRLDRLTGYAEAKEREAEGEDK